MSRLASNTKTHQGPGEADKTSDIRGGKYLGLDSLDQLQGEVIPTACFLRDLFFDIRWEHLNNPRFDAEILKKTISLFAESLDPKKLVLTMEDLTIDPSQLRDKDEEELILELSSLALDLSLKFQNRRDAINEGLANFDTTQVTGKGQEYVGERWASRYLSTESYALNLLDLGYRFADISRYLFLRHVAEGGQEEEFPRYLKNTFNLWTGSVDGLTFEGLRVHIASAMARSLDPHTMVAQKLDRENVFSSAPHGEFAGIGASIEAKDGRFFIRGIHPGSPAEESVQLMVGDELLSVESDSGTTTVSNLEIDRVVAAIRGDPGTTVTLKMRARSDGKEYQCDLVRAIVQVSRDRVRSQVVQMPPHLDAEKSKIGYIVIPGFYEGSNSRHEEPGTAKEVEKALIDLKAVGVDMVVLDLSDNGGGSVGEVLDIIKMFVNREELSMVASSQLERRRGSLGRTIWDGPVVILTSELSASGSEMLAAAFKSYERGLIVGEKTFGKGTVQTVREIEREQNPSLQVKITTEYFKAPDGSVIQPSGVKPDVFLRNKIISGKETNFPNSLAIGKGGEKKAVSSYGLVNDSIISELRDASTLRVEQTAQMQVLEDLVMRDKETSGRIPLGRKAFMKGHESSKERPKLWPRADRGSRSTAINGSDEMPALLTDPVIREACQIAVDYLAILEKRGCITRDR
jgi:carboxyl-terminal processing protease